MHECKFLTEGCYRRLVISPKCIVQRHLLHWRDRREFNVTLNTGDTEVTSTTLSAGMPMVKFSNKVMDELNNGVNVALPLSMDLLAAPLE